MEWDGRRFRIAVMKIFDISIEVVWMQEVQVLVNSLGHQ